MASAEQTAEQQGRIQAALGPNYDVQRRIGSGGFAEVWAAFDRNLQRTVAVKVLHPDLVATHALLERFKREAQAVAKLRHPGVIPIYAVGEYEGLAYYIMPLVEGESLRERLTREGRLAPEEAGRILREATAALAAAHRAGIVHRDIKPENLMLEGEERRLLVMDFGIAKSTTGTQTGLTDTGMIIGTPTYMSPEQATGSKEVDVRSDVYSLGVVGYELLTGKPPFTAQSVPELIMHHVTTPAPSVAAGRADVPESLAIAVNRCLMKEPGERWRDAGELSAFLQGTLMPAVQPATVSSELRKYARRGWRWGGPKPMAAAALVLVAGAGVILWQRSSSRASASSRVRVRQVTFRGDVCYAAMSANGRFAAYSAAQQFWIADLDRDRAWAVSDSMPEYACHGLYGELYPRWVEGGSRLAFRHGDYTWEADTSGVRAHAVGPRWVLDSLAGPSGRVFGWVYPKPGDTTSLPTLMVQDTGRAAKRMSLPGFKHRTRYYIRGAMSPDGSRALVEETTPSASQASLVDADAGLVFTLYGGARDHFLIMGWSGDSRAIYVAPDSGAGVLRLDLDAKRRHLAGRSTLLLPLIDSSTYNFSFAARRNRVLFVQSRQSADVVVGRLVSGGSRSGLSIKRVTAGSLLPTSAALTPAGDQLLFIAQADSTYGLFRLALAGGAPQRLASVASARDGAGSLRISADGGTAALIAITSQPNAHLRLVLVDLRSGATRELTGWSSSGVMSSCPGLDWDPAGRSILASNVTEGGTTSIVRVSAVSGAVDTIRPDSASTIWCPCASPDGRWVAVVDNVRPDSSGILLLSLTGDSPRFLPVPRSKPIGWLGPREVAVLRFSDLDSAEVWRYDLGGARSLVGRMPRSCREPALSSRGTAIVCVDDHTTSDLWVADDFDPYYQPAAAPARKQQQ